MCEVDAEVIWPGSITSALCLRLCMYTDGLCRLFVLKTFCSQERKVPMENFRSWGTKVPGNLELSFPGPFVLRIFRPRELSFPYLRALFYNSSLGVVIVIGRRVTLLEDVGFMFKYLSITVVWLTEERKNQHYYSNHKHKKVRKITPKVHININVGLCIAKAISTYIIT